MSRKYAHRMRPVIGTAASQTSFEIPTNPTEYTWNQSCFLPFLIFFAQLQDLRDLSFKNWLRQQDCHEPTHVPTTLTHPPRPRLPRTHHVRSPDHVYDELKKVLILAGAFFFITIVCVMSKLQ
ncbi:hypothetical protein OSTOST_09036, partial [Ostertagia ostertagi]